MEGLDQVAQAGGAFRSRISTAKSFNHSTVTPNEAGNSREVARDLQETMNLTFSSVILPLTLSPSPIPTQSHHTVEPDTTIPMSLPIRRRIRFSWKKLTQDPWILERGPNTERLTLSRGTEGSSGIPA